MLTEESPPVDPSTSIAADTALEPIPVPATPVFGARRAVWIVTCYFAAQFIFVFVAAVALTFATALRQTGGNKPPPLSAGMLMALGVVGALIGGLVAYRMARRSFPASSPGELERTLGVSVVQPRLLALAAVSGVAIAVFNVLVLMRTFPPSNEQQLGPLVLASREGGWAHHLVAAFAVFVAPPVEEFVFRGVLFSGLARSSSVGIAACVSTVVFALVHISGWPPYWPAIAAVLLLSGAAQRARIVSGSLAPGLAMHVAYNVGLMLASYL
jgi:membrane protease YdiL (CAAX protease family)